MERAGVQIPTWGAAVVKSAVILAYVVIATVWIPDWVLSLKELETASRARQDLVVSVVWAALLGAGLIGMRMAQRRGLI